MRTNCAERPFASMKGAPYEAITEYLCDIFASHKAQDGYVCIRSGPKTAAAQSWICVDMLKENLAAELSRHDYRDCYFSFSTFKKGRHPRRTEDNIQNIFAWSIDVDYKNGNVRPSDMFQYIIDNVSLPLPNYVEYGHRLRMIYLFAEPLRLFPKQRDSLLKGFRFLQNAFCQMINDELGFVGESFGAESNPPSSFFRIPGSRNTKDGSAICIEHITDERWTLQELFEEWIPENIIDPSRNKEEWYLTWKAKQKARPVHTVFNSKMLWERRMAALCELRTIPNPHRKKTCFYYSVGLANLCSDLSSEEFMDRLGEFNSGFANPLPRNILRRTFKWQAVAKRRYPCSDKRIAQELEVDEAYFSSPSKKERDDARYKVKRAEQIKKGNAKFQKMQKRQGEVFMFRKSGCSLSSIAKKLGVSLSTIKRDIEAIGTQIEKTVSGMERTASEGMKKAVNFARRIVETKKKPEESRLHRTAAHMESNDAASVRTPTPSLPPPLTPCLAGS